LLSLKSGESGEQLAWWGCLRIFGAAELMPYMLGFCCPNKITRPRNVVSQLSGAFFLEALHIFDF